MNHWELAREKVAFFRCYLSEKRKESSRIIVILLSFFFFSAYFIVLKTNIEILSICFF